MDTLKLFIDGQEQAGNGGEFPTINPANGQEICMVTAASQEDIEKAVASAKKGFEQWSRMLPVERGRILQRAAQLLRERNNEIAALEVQDTGKPIFEAAAVDVVSAADCLEYYAGIAAGINGEQINLGNNFAYTRREPLGICAGIGAWNYPVQIACWKAAPALACGNVMIFKPAELTPLTSNIVASVFKEAGMPDGVFNVVHGDGEVGAMLTRHPAIAKVTLTGEVGTGKKVMAGAAESLKKVTLELGGKSPILVFEDADIEEAVYGAMLGNFYTQGEICSNGTRVFVHENILDSFVEKLKSESVKLKIGNPADSSTRIGCMINPTHGEKVLGYIQKAKDEQATLLFGGERVTVNGCEDGCFIEPTAFLAHSDEETIVNEEIFGPVMTILSFKDEQEVINRANNTPFGLAAGVFTKDIRRAHRVVARLEAGMCWINAYNLNPVEIPFGGYKESGVGRENGWAAIEHFTQIKTVYVGMEKLTNPFE